MKKGKRMFLIILMVILTGCSNSTPSQPIIAETAKNAQNMLKQQGETQATELTQEEMMGIRILVTASINAASGTMEGYLVDQKNLESDDQATEFDQQTLFIMSVYSRAYADESKKRLSKVVEKIDGDAMLLTQGQLFSLLRMAGAEPTETLLSYDYLKQWYQDGYYKINQYSGAGESYQKINFGKIQKMADGRVLADATLWIEPDFGAVKTFRFTLTPNTNSIFQYTVERVRAELVQPEGVEAIGTNVFMQTPYVSPSQMSKDPFDYIFELDGSLYQMPFPAKELERHGWEMEESGNLEPGERKKIHVKKGNIQLTLGLWNYNVYTSELDDCQVVWMKTGQDKAWNPVNFKLAEGVANRMTRGDVEPIYHNYLGVYTYYGRSDALYKNVCGYVLHFDHDMIDGFEMGYAPTPIERQKRILLMTGSWDKDPKTTPNPNESFEVKRDHVYRVDIDGDGVKEELCVKTLGGIDWAGYTCLFVDGRMNYVVEGAVSDQLDCYSMKMLAENGRYYFAFEGGDYANDVYRKVCVEKGWSKEVANGEH